MITKTPLAIHDAKQPVAAKKREREKEREKVKSHDAMIHGLSKQTQWASQKALQMCHIIHD
jgi:hypothetical protein